MQITDFSYLDDLLENDLILGSAAAVVTTNASSLGNGSYTVTNVNVKKQSLPNHISIIRGSGSAVAFGEHPSAEVIVGGSADILILTSQSQYSSSRNIAVATGSVIAIDVFKNKN